MLKFSSSGPHLINTETIKQIDLNKYEVVSISRKGISYIVTMIDKGIGVGTCPDHEFRYYKQCKHINEILDEVGI